MMDANSEKLARSVARLLRAANDVMEDAKGVTFTAEQQDASLALKGLLFECDETCGYAEFMLELLGISPAEALQQVEVA